ncbi:hypothetical protein [Petrocella sp. FN5]|uniref:hypothetical protein n=1 Tax=Petrocella sp. FN5 TaxID=3032002 RepID=UPI0023DAAD1A|nr:hypothetical protein [Petrocella sp. FN5]MDF1617859.1 hypothetical protein [Petrocella sp. FN5]
MKLLKKAISLLLLTSIITSVYSVPISASESVNKELSEANIIEKIIRVNGLTRDEANIVRESLESKIATLSKDEFKNLQDSMKTFEADYLKKKNSDLDNDVTISTNLIAPRSSGVIIMKVYVGNIAPITGYMFMANAQGVQFIDDLIGAGAGLASIGGTFLMMSSILKPTSALAAAVGGWLVFNIHFMKAQITYGSTYAIAYI